MSATIEGRLVVVTGAANGIGAALASASLGRGAAHVVLIDVAGDEVEAAAAALSEGGGSVSAEVCDVSDADAVFALAAEVIAEHGLPGLVCANAGVGPDVGPLLDATIDDVRWVFGVNVVGVLATLQAFGRPMAAADTEGWLLATASEHGLGVPHLGNGVYTSSKHAVIGMCDVIRRELPAGLGMSVLCPGLTISDFWRSAAKRPESHGGPGAANDLGRAVLAQGMAPELVAERALDGVDRGDFLIPTHYNTKDYADARAAEVVAAFDRLADIDTSTWHVDDAIAAVFSSLEGDS
ncbi:MAG: SDR family NAD(P)-dependent oxidoreductase [Acidimicrobiales bacterium]